MLRSECTVHFLTIIMLPVRHFVLRVHIRAVSISRNAGLFHGTDECDHGTINLILEYFIGNGYYIVLIN